MMALLQKTVLLLNASLVQILRGSFNSLYTNNLAPPPPGSKTALVKQYRILLFFIDNNKSAEGIPSGLKPSPAEFPKRSFFCTTGLFPHLKVFGGPAFARKPQGTGLGPVKTKLPIGVKGRME
jgi:hypothetical protein